MSALIIKGISKRFGSLLANDDISLTLEPGEVLALLGENGAGKTTLMNILFGHYIADSGTIEVEEQTLPPGSTDAAIAAGVGMVHQHFTLADNMTVLENIMVGTESLKSWRSATTQARRRLTQMATELGFTVQPDRRLAELSVGERQRVEILKALYRNARILILDEPTAVLTPQEVTRLFDALRAMVARGLGIIFISHKLHEILRISDRVAVLRRGRLVAEMDTAQANRETLAELMVGHKVHRPRIDHLAPGETIIQLNNVSVGIKRPTLATAEKVVSSTQAAATSSAMNTTPRPRLDQVSLTVNAREIIGVAGVAGNGQATLAGVLSGMIEPSAGSLQFLGRSIRRFSPRDFIAMGIGRIPEDRHSQGVVAELAVWENAIIENLRQAPFWRWRRFIDRRACRRFAAELIEQFDIRCNSMDIPARLLSGGNMQKLILARALRHQPKFILANQPVRGLDEGAIAAVHRRLLQAKRQGSGVLILSEDLDELLTLADKIVVMYRGRISAALPVHDVSAQDLGAMMAGDLERVVN